MKEYDDEYLVLRQNLQSSLAKLCPNLVVIGAIFNNEKWYFGIRLKLKNDFFLIHGNYGYHTSSFHFDYWLEYLRQIRFGKDGFLDGMKLDDIVEVGIELNFLPHKFNINTLRSLGVAVNTEYNTRFFQASIYVANARYLSNLNLVKSVKLINQKPRF